MAPNLFLRCTISRPAPVKCFTPFLHNPIMRYSEPGKESNSRHGMMERERAPSTAEEFKRVAKEKIKEAEQGVASQTSEKVYDGVEEATLGDSNLDSAKKRYEEHEPGADYRKRG